MSLINPVKGAVTVTPSDTTTFNLTSCLWVGTSGNLTVLMENGQQQLFPNASGWMPIRCTKVMASGTGASGIVAGYSD